MIRVFNFTRSGSKTTGWKVIIDAKDNPKYRVKLDGSNSNIGLNIDDDSYLKLTTQHGIDPYAMSKLAVVMKDGVLTPYVVSADVEEDVAIVLLNFEADVGTIISSVDMNNACAIAYYVNPDINNHSISLSAISLDPKLPISISIKYGCDGGKSLSSMLVTIDGKDRTMEHLSKIDTENIRLGGDEYINPTEIILPRINLSDYLIDKR